jgi:hypothetical protein
MKLSTVILSIFSVAVAPVLAEDECVDAKGKAHIGNGKTTTCKKLQNFLKNGRDKKVAEICETNDLGPDGEPPANELCKLSCDNCDSKDERCMYFYYSELEYENNYVLNYLYGSDDCIDGYDEETMLCSGDTFTVSPVNLYWDPDLYMFGGIVTASGSIVNATASEAPIALTHGSIEPKIPGSSVEGKFFWQDLEDWSSDIYESAVTGATGVFTGFMGTATYTYSDMPYVELKVCPPEGWDPERKIKELAKSGKRLR